MTHPGLTRDAECVWIVFCHQTTLHVNGNGAGREYSSNSKPSTSSSVVDATNHGVASSSVSHSISRPTTIPGQNKRQKLSYYYANGKNSRLPSSSSSCSQPSSASSSSPSSSVSSPNSTSDIFPDIPSVRHLNHVKRKPYSNGDSHTRRKPKPYLVPYSQETSEESDGEDFDTQVSDFDNGHLNGNGKMGEVLEKPQVANGESGVLHNGHRINGSPSGTTQSSQNEHRKVNGHDATNEVIRMLCVLWVTKQQLCIMTNKECFFFPSQNSCSYYGSPSPLFTAAANGPDNDHIQTEWDSVLVSIICCASDGLIDK